jgi:hypothetical protein
MSRLFNSDDIFQKGPYKEESLYDVADEDSEYLQELLNGDDLAWEDRSSIMGALGLDIPEEEE